MERDLKKKISEQVTKHSREDFLQRLLGEGVSLSTAQKLVCGGYQYNPEPLLLKAIERAMKSPA